MPSPTDIIRTHAPSLSSYESVYKHIHSNPELSNLEHETTSTISSYLSSLAPDLEQHILLSGTALAAVLRNGDGPTVLLRADMDALPVAEKTGLPYASTKRMKDAHGEEQPVMHACGHDMHVSCLLAAAELLVKAREEWSGTCVFAFQPAEEVAMGARRMVNEGGLYEEGKGGVPVPDVVLGGHVVPLRAGVVGTRRGLMLTAADSMQITLHGSGGHASEPNRTTDPIIMAASTIQRLQTIVSREIEPGDATVVTVASVHAGGAENIIPDSARLKLNVRTVKPETRKKVISAIHRMVDAEAAASGAPKKPEFATLSSFPFTFNDPDVTAKLEDAFAAHFGEAPTAYVRETQMMRASEDFSILGTSVEKPCSFFVYGGTDPELFDRAEKEGRLKEDVPINHSPYFAPVIQPTMKAGMEAYAAAALAWLAKS